MSKEIPHLGPDDLPEDPRLESEVERELSMVEKGVDPNVIASVRKLGKKWLAESPDAKAIREEYSYGEELDDE